MVPENKSKQKFININDKKYNLENGTLVILVSNINSSLELFNIETNIDLISQNQFLLHNGDWWVSLKEDPKVKKDLILNKKYKALKEEFLKDIIEEKIEIKEIKKED